MYQPITGVTPASVAEVTIMTVWPSIAAYRLGRFLGRAYALSWPNWHVVRLGNLIALLTIPCAAGLYLWRIAPKVGVRYTLTNRRIALRRGLQAQQSGAIAFDAFDTVAIEMLPGQAWFNAGDVVFRHAGAEVFRLPAVARPEAFQQVIWKVRAAFLGVEPAGAQPAGPT